VSDWAPIFAMVASFLTCVLALFAAWNAYQARRSAVKAAEGLIEIDGKVFSLSKSVDGRLSALLAAKDDKAASDIGLARAQGHAEGEQAQRDRSAEAQP